MRKVCEDDYAERKRLTGFIKYTQRISFLAFLSWVAVRNKCVGEIVLHIIKQ